MSGYYNRNNRGITKKLGPVTAYADAVLAGYKGTREQWAQDMAKLGQNVTQVAQNTKLTTELAERTRENTEQVAKDTADVRRLADETGDNAAQVASNTAESNRLAEETKQAAAQAKADAEYAGAAADNFRVDTTLSEEGKAAEAKTTGEKFAQLSEEKAEKSNVDELEWTVYGNLAKTHRSRNLYNPAISFVDGVIYTTGELLVNGYEGNITSDFIAVKPNSSLVFTRLATATSRIGAYVPSVAYYDNKKVFISADYGTSKSVFSTPVNCSYIRFTDTGFVNNDTAYKYMIEYGTEVIADVSHYEPYYEPYVEVIAYPKTTEEIVCWGDSLTYGTGASESESYPAVLARMTGKTVHKCGYPGDDSAEIAGYQGALPLMVEPCTIPATGSVVVTLYDYKHSDATPFRFPNIGDGTGVNPVTIAGVEGNLDLSASANVDGRTFTFTRLTDGNAVTINYPVPLETSVSIARRNDIAVIFVGSNAGWDGDIQVLNRQINRMIDYQSALEKKYIVIGLLNGTEAAYGSRDRAMLDAFGRHFINMRDYLSKCGMSDNGLTPTAEDAEKMAAGAVPASLLISDGVHMNKYGYYSFAKRVCEKGKELGYW